MKATSFLPLGALVAAVSAQADIFEPADFNVTEALIANGVNVSAIPELAGLVERTLLSGCSIACSSLKLIYGSSKLFSEGTTSYDAFTAGYWSDQQSAVNPRCVFKPANTLEVSSLVLMSRLTQCPFAVKGGGHVAWAGASSIEGGITVSMESFKQVTVSKDKKHVDVGPGNRWVDVYTNIEKSGLSVVGGRVSKVGVPGLLLGGGISYFSNKVGWACDNVASYEVVTASGVVVTASLTKFPDLYWALKGGGNNFGIVTNFKLVAFPLGMMWGGQRVFMEDSIPAIMDAAYKFATTGSSKDPDAAEIYTFTTIPQVGKVAVVQTHYAQPIANASVFDDIAALTPIDDNTGFGSHAELTVKLGEGSPDGQRYSDWMMSLKADRQILTFLVDTFYKMLPEVEAIANSGHFLVVQLITEGQLKGMQRNGGNALGLSPDNGPLYIVNPQSQWHNEADDAKILNFWSKLFATVRAEAQKKDLNDDYIYMNYASPFQDPIASYGAANVQKLKVVSKKYDPAQVFQRLVPGHFKLTKGAPISNLP